MTAAGWYYIPGEGRERYFDGREWTNAYRDASAPAPAGQQASRPGRLRTGVNPRSRLTQGEAANGSRRCLLAVLVIVGGAASLNGWPTPPEQAQGRLLRRSVGRSGRRRRLRGGLQDGPTVVWSGSRPPPAPRPASARASWSGQTWSPRPPMWWTVQRASSSASARTHRAARGRGRSSGSTPKPMLP